MSYIKLPRSYNEIKKLVTSRKASLGCICWAAEVGMGLFHVPRPKEEKQWSVDWPCQQERWSLRQGKVTQISWGNTPRLVPGKPHLILKLKGETLIATSAEAGIGHRNHTWHNHFAESVKHLSFLKWVFALSVHFTDFPSRQVSRIPPVLCLPSLRLSQRWPLWQIHNLFSATYPGARPSAAKLRSLDSSPVHRPSRDLG